MRIADNYIALTNHRYLYSLMPIANIPSVMSNGILSKNLVTKSRLKVTSVADQSVQNRRDSVRLKNKPLHDYANLYFSYWNPMLSRIRSQNEHICILCIDARVLDLDGCIVTDRNAASQYFKPLDPATELNNIDFEKVHAQWWTNSTDYQDAYERKQIKCAEVLIPNRIDPSYICMAYVVSEKAEEALRRRFFDRKIIVDRSRFF